MTPTTNIRGSSPVVVLINPFYEHFPGRRRLCGYSEPQVGLAYLASSAAAAAPGVRVEIIDQCIENMSYDSLIKKLGRDKPDVVGFYSATLTMPQVSEAARRIKACSQETLIVLGGPHISSVPADLPASIDIGVVGEGEETFAEIVSRRMAGDSLDDVLGTVSKVDEIVRIQAPRGPIEPIDSIAFPAHALLAPKRYTYQYPTRSKSPHFLSVVASRGCPFNCSFCAKNAVWGRTVRRRSPENVVAELQAIRRLGVDLFSFRDDTFTHNSSFVSDLCELMINEQLDMRWACLGRADQVDDETADLLARAGCFEMHIGVETADVRTLERTEKKLRKDKTEAGFRRLKEQGIRAKGTFILGLPGEDEATIRRTVEYAVELNPAFCFFSCFIPYPGTAHYEEYRDKKLLLTDDYSRFNYHGDPIVESPELSAERLGRLRRWAYRRFFLRPSKLMQIFRDLLREGGIVSLARGVRSFINVAR